SDGIGGDLKIMLGSLAVLPLLFLSWALFQEKRLGRLDRIQDDAISRAWIEENLLREKPEVIGAIWDGSVGAPEVSAILARMVGEGRLESKIEDDEMALTLKSREGLNDYEKELID